MLLDKCVLESDIFVTAPLVRSKAEDEWLSARASGAIPEELFMLYCRANYLSFGAGTKFLSDPDNVLFSYFSMILRSVMESLTDAERQVVGFTEAQRHTYDAGKKLRGETWDPTADARARRHFRDLLIALQSGLDALADLIALFFTGLVPGLSIGRAHFSRVEAWVRRPKTPTSAIVTPQTHYLHELHDVLHPLVNAVGAERDWLPLMRMLRNKAAHLGQPVFRQVGLHDEAPQFYTFIPRQWPYIWEQHMKPSGSQPYAPGFLPKFFRETLIHQDVMTFVEGLRLKVIEVVRAGASVLMRTYTHVQDFEPNQSALAELQGNSEAYGFEHFQNA